MKTKFLSANFTLVFILLFTLVSTAQSTIGIPVQGIARDVNGTARINTQIDLTFDLYYIEGGNEVPLYTPSQIETVTTDSFGVFSSIVNTAGRRSVFGSKEVFLRIVESGTTISDEKLNSVPYAIAADNGVPTGAIMPFVGTTAPEGWLLCDGTAIPTGQQYDALKALYGNNTPNLQGMFLRGTGTSPVNGRPGPALGGTQDSAFRNHVHNVNLNTSSTPHTHTFDDIVRPDTGFIGAGGQGTSYATGDSTASISNTTKVDSGAHAHNVFGDTAFSGSPGSDFESRPVNYGVNYIIKL
ncbi:tail fiber protein [Winogradskyella jejuensis]|uniref:Microcystin-dependent protein n=1 Tax=Winogradskyella jejuensis TaxID=1089305 RepID=A0A1M5KH20_9FLAO|nr:tail fiber protein [Winogradskyella jejuensis]SHG51920.1 Microcystin-dependent protein [Winogradskyella jejuensis]